jgi:glycosyltransferase involved in cell wall biosynthesis
MRLRYLPGSGAGYTQDDPLVLTYTGSMLVQRKNIFTYVALAERLREAGIPLKLNLLGDGEQYDQLRWKMGGLVETGVVNMPGRVAPAQVAKELDDTDTFALPSDFEGLPMSVLEAMSLGVIPVIRDMKSGIREVVETGEHGFITARSDLGAMVEVLKDLQENPERRRALGHAVINSSIEHRLGKSDIVDANAALLYEVFAELEDRPLPRAMPLAYNALVYGDPAPPFLFRRD